MPACQKIYFVFSSSWFHFFPATLLSGVPEPPLIRIIHRCSRCSRKHLQVQGGPNKKSASKTEESAPANRGVGEMNAALGKGGWYFGAFLDIFFSFRRAVPGFRATTTSKKNPEKPEVRPEFRVTAPKKWEFVRIPCSHAPPRSVWEGGSGVPSLPWGVRLAKFCWKATGEGMEQLSGERSVASIV